MRSICWVPGKRGSLTGEEMRGQANKRRVKAVGKKRMNYGLLWCRHGSMVATNRGGKMSSILSILERFTTKGVVLGTAAMLAIACLSPQESDFDLRFRTFAAIVVGTLVAFGTSLH